MAKRSRKNPLESKFDLFDDLDDIDDDLNLEKMSRDFLGDEWEGYCDPGERGSARRKIERRHEMRRLYSELNDWEEFGESENWNTL